MAVVCRFFFGLFNGLTPSAKVYVSEILSTAQHKTGNNILEINYRIGEISGLALGGYLSRVNKTHIFGES